MKRTATYHSVDLAEERFAAGRICVASHAEWQRTRWHDHESACAHFVLRGVYVEQLEGGVRVALPGDVLVKRAGIPHRNAFGSVRAETLRFELDEDTVPAELASTPDLATLAALRSIAISLEHDAGRPLMQEALDLFRREGADSMRPPDLVAGRARARSTHAPEVRALFELRRRRQASPRLGQLARELGVHRSHLARQFRRTWGCSPQELVIRLRAAQLARRISAGEHGLAEMALDVGFSDQSHATRVFKRVLGTAPARWARELGV